jgi:hypothetical protein
MQAVTVGRRLADRILIIPTWQRVCNEVSYIPSPETSIQDTFGGHNYVRTFATILYQGLWLQRAVAERLSIAESLAEELTEYSDFGNTTYEDSNRERVGAAFLLWPFYSAKYYGYLGVSKTERLKSRRALCDIQAILYNNVRPLLDILRLWFDCYDDSDLGAFVKHPLVRSSWRPAKLTQNSPDLCAVDFLVEHLLEVMKARPLVRKAIESVQEISLNSDVDRSEEVRKAVHQACADVSAAFKTLRLSQMTVFYNPEPSKVGTDEIPLRELVHGTKEDPIPSMLIPFEGEPTLVKNFRQLASNIYSDSAKSRQSYPSFFQHRKAVINLLKAEAAASSFAKGATRFFSDGQTTSSFLSSEPPRRKPAASSSSNGNSQNGQDELWPIWYSKSLGEIDMAGDFPDWSDWDFWWQPVDDKELGRRLFQSADGETQLHQNHHKSAYWDELARTGTLLRTIKIPKQRPTSAPQFGHLMELLLRRESETRTSFFFALAQTYEENNARLCHFVGGTFLGLERPGIPFSEERFRALAARIRGLVMAVGHYTATHAVKSERKEELLGKNDFSKRLDKVVSLMRGKDAPYNRQGDLLFASRAERGKPGSDHNLSSWRPSRQQIKQTFHDAAHLQPPTDDRAIPAKCDRTWKGLFYLGGDSELHFTLRKFWDDVEDALTGEGHGMSHRKIACEACFKVVCKFLIGRKFNVEEGLVVQTPFRLPSRPGIRFLFVVCRFVAQVQEEISDDNSSVTGVEFSKGLVRITFDNPNLVEILKEHGDELSRFSHTIGRFQALKTGTVFSKPDESKGGVWASFLNYSQFASPLQIEVDPENCQISLRWKDEDNISVR